MPTELDKDIQRITEAVTAPGQMFELTQVTRRGVTMPAFKNAPPSVAHYFAHFCNEKKDETFIVEGELILAQPGFDGAVRHGAPHPAALLEFSGEREHRRARWRRARDGGWCGTHRLHHLRSGRRRWGLGFGCGDAGCNENEKWRDPGGFHGTSRSVASWALA